MIPEVHHETATITTNEPTQKASAPPSVEKGNTTAKATIATEVSNTMAITTFSRVEILSVVASLMDTF